MDTAVVKNGEYIKPLPMEDKILDGSPMIEQVMLMGQDGWRLVAICIKSKRGCQWRIYSILAL
jgi:long-subunit acyl-CoA synthetase (AMP-forming)